MAAHMVKCRKCGKRFDTETTDFVMPKPRFYFHVDCLDNQSLDELEFFDYASKLFGKEYNHVVTRQLAEQYIEQYKYSYPAMLKSLIWFYEVEHHTIENSNGTIGIIPYVYDNAKEYFYDRFLVHEANMAKNIDDYIPKTIEVEVEVPTIKIKPHRLFNMDEE